jgi:predicted acylesterase/phospholipase RssA
MRRGSTIVGSVLLAACASIHRAPTTVDQLLTDAAVARTEERALRDTVISRLARRLIDKPTRTVDILLLSGGGQNGAYGVGFLQGWRTNAAAPMPTFDLITAISTGALQAPFALLGPQPALDTLAELYRQAPSRTAPTLDWWFLFRRTGGIVNAKRYNASIAQVIDTAFRAQLRPAFAEGRQVVIGTTDLDLAIGRTWDLQTMLDTGTAGLTRTHALLRAASSIPGIFPPVLMQGHVHSDGGIVNNLLPLLTADDYAQVVARVRAAGVQDTVQIRLWAIVNGWTHGEPVVMNPSSRKQIGKRWSTIMFYAGQPQVLQHLEHVTRAVAAAVPGVRMQLRWSAVPSDVSRDPGARTFFNTAWIQRMEALGRTRALSAAPWDSIVSPYSRPAPLAP